MPAALGDHELLLPAGRSPELPGGRRGEEQSQEQQAPNPATGISTKGVAAVPTVLASLLGSGSDSAAATEAVLTKAGRLWVSVATSMV